MTKQELDCHVCSLSTSTVVYKGPFTSHQLFKYYDDLSNPEYQTHLALVHSRFSTDSIPSWTHAPPKLIFATKLKLWQFRDNLGDSMMRGRGRTLESEYQRDDFEKFYPIGQEGLADSRRLDHVIKYLVGALPETAMTILPDALEKDEDMSTEKKKFYRCATMRTEFCDEPALIALADGSSIGMALDRIDFPTAQYHFTKDGHLYLSSETGVFDIPDESVVKKVHLRPGCLLLVDAQMERIKAEEDDSPPTLQTTKRPADAVALTSPNFAAQQRKSPTLNEMRAAQGEAQPDPSMALRGTVPQTKPFANASKLDEIKEEEVDSPPSSPINSPPSSPIKSPPTTPPAPQPSTKTTLHKAQQKAASERAQMQSYQQPSAPGIHAMNVRRRDLQKKFESLLLNNGLIGQFTAPTKDTVKTWRADPFAGLTSLMYVALLQPFLTNSCGYEHDLKMLKEMEAFKKQRDAREISAKTIYDAYMRPNAPHEVFLAKKLIDAVVGGSKPRQYNAIMKEVKDRIALVHPRFIVTHAFTELEGIHK